MQFEENEIILSASTRAISKECHRKMFHSFELREYGLVREFHTDPDPPIPPEQSCAGASDSGNAIHDWCEARLLKLDDPEEYARENRPHYPEVCPKGSQHSWSYARITLSAYKKKYPLDLELPVWETPDGILSLEHKWTEPSIKEGSMFRDKGFFDRVVFCESGDAFLKAFGTHPTESLTAGGVGREIRDGGELILVDIKSTGRKLNDRQWRAKLYSNVQFPLYCHQLHQMSDKFHGLVMVDAIQHTKTRRAFERFFFEYSLDDIADAIELSDLRVARALETPDDFDSSQCFAWGRKCPFFRLCHDPEYASLPVEERLRTFLLENPTSVDPVAYQHETHKCIPAQPGQESETNESET